MRDLREKNWACSAINSLVVERGKLFSLPHWKKIQKVRPYKQKTTKMFSAHTNSDKFETRRCRDYVRAVLSRACIACLARPHISCACSTRTTNFQFPFAGGYLRVE